MITQDNVIKQVEILHTYFIDTQTIQTPAGFSAALYRENLEAMLAELREAGLSDGAIVAVTGDGPLAHANGAFLNYHLVIHSSDTGRIYDPLYGGKEPLARENYANRVFPEENNIRLWRQTAHGKYQQEL